MSEQTLQLIHYANRRGIAYHIRATVNWCRPSRWLNRWRLWGMHEDLMRERVKVETYLINAAAGKKPLPDADKCRELASRLGTPRGR